jgi:endonuclease G
MMLNDPTQLLNAAKRFQQTVTRRAVTGPRERTNYLAKNLAKAKAVMLAAEATVAGAGVNAGETVAQLSQERIVGSSDLVDINYLELAISMGRGVSRVQIGGGFGTGFLMGPGLAMTNHHVIQDESDARRAIFQFDYQDNASKDLLPRQDFAVDLTKFFLTNADLDFTIVALVPLSTKGQPLDAYPWIKLIGETGKAENGDPINIIQHPRGGLKQIAFRENKIIDIPQGKKEFLYYTTDTEPGSSGSPCFNDQWELVALHHSGVPATDEKGQILRKDKEPWRNGVDPEGMIDWIGNEGARVSAIVAAMRAADIKAEWRDARDKALESAPPNPIELARTSSQKDTGKVISIPAAVDQIPTAHAIEGGPMGQSFTWTIPIQVTVSVGGAAAVPSAPISAEPKAAAVAVPAAVPAAAAVAAVVAPAEAPAAAPAVVAMAAAAGAGPAGGLADGAVEVTIDQDWAKRKGYDPMFLGVSIPLPKLSAAQEANTVEVPPQFRKGTNKFVLNYHHYSVAMNKKRRTAWYSAGMIDGTHFQDFKRGKDKWFLDARIDPKFQMGEELYSGARTDRGHLTRFKDLSWGPTKADAVNATNDSFHFTNCTLQLDQFNEGKSRWQGLEQFLLEQNANKDDRKMIVITGTVLLDSDPMYHNKAMNYSTRIPLAFWKVCCLRRKDGSLAATGFKLGQEDITELPGFAEAFDVGLAQVAISELEKLTGLDFGVLTKHDHFAAGGGPGTLEIASPDGDKRRIKPIAELTDIVI